MLYDSVNLLEGAEIQNFTVDSGTAFPASPVTAQLFFRTDASKLYAFNGTTWSEILQAGSAEVDVPKITSVVITNSSYSAISDLGVDYQNGGYVKIIGTGFKAGAAVYAGSVAATSTTFVSNTEIRAQLPALPLGTHILYVINSDGSSGMYVDGVTAFSLNDAYFKNVSSLLKTTSVNNGQNNTFTDSSSNNLTISTAGSPGQGSFSPFSNIGWSAYFNGTSDRLNVNGVLESITTGPFCMEMWILPTKVNCQIASNFFWKLGHNGGWLIGLSATGQMTMSASAPTWNSLPAVFTTSNTVNMGEWNHIAVTRDSSNNLRCFINGQLGATTTYSTSLAINTGAYTNERVGLTLGASGPWDGNYTNFFEGYISNFRIVTGSALYTSAFTPPSSVLTAITDTKVLLVNDPYLKDLSANNYSITNNGADVVRANPFSSAVSYSAATHGGSISCSGAGDYYLTTTTSNTFASGDFTMEGWFYITANNTDYVNLLRAYSTGFRFGNSGFGYKLQCSIDDASASNIWSTSLTQDSLLNRWVHIAFTRSSGTCRFFVNGVVQSLGNGINPSSYPATSFTDNTSIVDRGLGIGSGLNGYVSNVRIVKGSALYTSNFTPSSSPLTAVTGTVFLLSAANANIYDASCNSNFTTMYDAKVSTSLKKYGASSMVSDASNDYLVAPASPAFLLLNDNFTVEFWAYFTNGSEVAERILFSMTDGTSTNNFYLSKSNTGSYAGKLCVFVGNSSTTTALLADTTYPASNTWIHFAVTRSGNNFTLWENGVSAATGTFSGNVTTSGAKLYLFGTGGASTFPGNIQDFRITKGIARYTSAFTPPSAVLPDR